MASGTFNPRDRYRLPATVATTGSWPFSFRNHLGYYYRASVQSGDAWVRRSRFGQPPFDGAFQVTTSGGVTRPTLAEDWRGRLWCVWTVETAGPTFDVYTAYSDDDAETWSTPVSLFASAKWGMPRQDPVTGNLLAFAYVGGVIKGRWQPTGETAWRTAATVQVSGVDVAVEDEAFGFEIMGEGTGRIILCLKKSGGTDLTEFRSADEDTFDFEEL